MARVRQSPHRVIACLVYVAVCTVYGPASAQDMTPINPADWARPNVMVEGMRAHSGGKATRTHGGLSGNSVRTCRNAFRMEGSDEEHRRKLTQLRALCRRGATAVIKHRACIRCCSVPVGMALILAAATMPAAAQVDPATVGLG